MSSSTPPIDPTTCQHMDFVADVKIARLEDIGRFMAEIRVSCAHCKKPFQFLGLEPGLDLSGARVSLDGLEANIAIVPEGTQPSPLQRLAWGVRGFDG